MYPDIQDAIKFTVEKRMNRAKFKKFLSERKIVSGNVDNGGVSGTDEIESAPESSRVSFNGTANNDGDIFRVMQQQSRGLTRTSTKSQVHSFGSDSTTSEAPSRLWRSAAAKLSTVRAFGQKGNDADENDSEQADGLAVKNAMDVFDQ